VVIYKPSGLGLKYSWIFTGAHKFAEEPELRDVAPVVTKYCRTEDSNLPQAAVENTGPCCCGMLLIWRILSWVVMLAQNIM
jgi:hypothetical protein